MKMDTRVRYGYKAKERKGKEGLLYINYNLYPGFKRQATRVSLLLEAGKRCAETNVRKESQQMLLIGNVRRDSRPCVHLRNLEPSCFAVMDQPHGRSCNE